MQIIFTSPKKTKKRKPTAKQRELQKSWNLLIKKYATKNEVPKKQDLSEVYSLGKPACRETPNIPSLPYSPGVCTKKESVIYTGTKVKGIGTMHKSNAVPIFSDDEAKEIATMRR